MCLTTNNPELKIAREDIICYKYGSFHNNNKSLMSGVMDYVYKVGEVQPIVELKPELRNKNYEVTKGYHSYNDPHYTNAIFIIPKGSFYIDGWSNGDTDIPNRVSSQIIFIGKRNFVTEIKLRIRKLFKNVQKKKEKQKEILTFTD